MCFLSSLLSSISNDTHTDDISVPDEKSLQLNHIAFISSIPDDNAWFM